MSLSTRSVAALASVAVLAGGGAAVASAAFGGDTTVTVKPTQTLAAGATSPFDAPGVKAIRQGKPIPSGYKVLRRQVEIERGASIAGAAIRFACPGATRLATFATTGRAGFSVRDAGYVGRKTAFVMSIPGGTYAQQHKQIDGSVYAICR